MGWNEVCKQPPGDGVLVNDIMCGRKPINEFHTPTTELQWEVANYILQPNPLLQLSWLRVMDLYIAT